MAKSAKKTRKVPTTPLNTCAERRGADERTRARECAARARRACCRENLFVSLAYSAVNAIAPGRLTYLRASNEGGGRRRRAGGARGGRVASL